MNTKRIHITMPDGLLEDIDSEVGRRGRNAFIAEIARAELNKRRLLASEQGKVAWKPNDHTKSQSCAGA